MEGVASGRVLPLTVVAEPQKVGVLSDLTEGHEVYTDTDSDKATARALGDALCGFIARMYALLGEQAAAEIPIYISNMDMKGASEESMSNGKRHVLFSDVAGECRLAFGWRPST